MIIYIIDVTGPNCTRYFLFFNILIDIPHYLVNRFLASYRVMILLDHQFLVCGFELTTDHDCIFGVDDVVLLAVHEQSRNGALIDVAELNLKRIVVELI